MPSGVQNPDMLECWRSQQISHLRARLAMFFASNVQFLGGQHGLQLLRLNVLISVLIASSILVLDPLIATGVLRLQVDLGNASVSKEIEAPFEGGPHENFIEVA